MTKSRFLCLRVRSVKDSGMVTEELAVKDRGVQAVKSSSHMVATCMLFIHHVSDKTKPLYFSTYFLQFVCKFLKKIFSMLSC